MAYDCAARQHYGEFAALNFPDATTYPARQARHTTSTYRGVFWAKGKKMWTARIAKDRRRYYLGFFNDEARAARTYDAKAMELYGPDAVLNFSAEIIQ